MKKDKIDRWIEEITKNFIDQVHPSSGEYKGIDLWMKYKDQLKEEILFLYNNEECWDRINKDDRCKIVTRIIDELEEEDR